MRRFARFSALSALSAAAIALGGLAISPRPAAADLPSDIDTTYADEGVAVIGAPDGVLVVWEDTDPSGRVVVLVHGPTASGLYRLTADGDPDVSFGGGGPVVLPSELSVQRLLATTEGVYVAGEVAHGSEPQVPFVARLTSSGALDPAWSGDGILELSAPGSALDRVDALAQGPAGEVAVAVRHEGSEPSGYELFRLLADGSIDAAFGGDGAVGVPAPRAIGWGAVQIDSVGRVVVADADETDSEDFGHRVRRFLPNGSLDPQFGVAGVTALGLGVATMVAISPTDGSIVLGGGVPSPLRPAVWKLQPDGRLDPAFGTSGRADGFAAAGLVADLVLLPDHRIAVANRGPGVDATGEVAFLVRPDGALETELGADGFLPAEAWSPWDGLGGGANGRLLVASSDVDLLHSQVTAYSTGDLPTVTPTITSVTAGRASLSVTWDPSEVEVGGPVRGYYVYASGGAAAFVAGDVRQVTLTGLTNGQAQQVRVLPFTDKGAMTASDPVSGTPSASAPAIAPASAARNVTAVPGKRFASVTWQPPADDGGSPIVGYSVIALRPDTNVVAAWRNVTGDVRSASLELADGVAHSVFVIPYTSAGFGSVAPAVPVTPDAAAAAPAAPTLPFAAATATGDSAYVAWGAAVEHGQAVTGYQILLMEGGQLTGWVSRGADERSATIAPITQTQSVDVYVIPNSASELGAPTLVHVRP